MIRKEIRFYGRVQGVGFRYHATNTARGLGLTGWVCNEYDGTVLMEVQGNEELIERMLQRLNQDRYIDIRDMEIRTLAVIEDEHGFGVKYS
jgi:acylphosphatase